MAKVEVSDGVLGEDRGEEMGARGVVGIDISVTSEIDGSVGVALRE